MINLFWQIRFPGGYIFLKKVVTLVDFENGSRPDADVVLWEKKIEDGLVFFIETA